MFHGSAGCLVPPLSVTWHIKPSISLLSCVLCRILYVCRMSCLHYIAAPASFGPSAFSLSSWVLAWKTTYHSFAIFSTRPGIPYIRTSLQGNQAGVANSRCGQNMLAKVLQKHVDFWNGRLNQKCCRCSSPAVLAAFALSGRLSESFPYCYSSVAFLIRTSNLLATHCMDVMGAVLLIRNYLFFSAPAPVFKKFWFQLRPQLVTVN